MISLKSAQEKVDYMDQYGLYAAARHLNISPNSLLRYERKVRLAKHGSPYELPNILLLDIETAPMMVFVWGLYKQRIDHHNVVSDWYVISWAAKWLFSSETLSAVLTPEEAKEHNDERIIKEMWKLLDMADIVIAHNGKRFDLRKLNSRFMVHHLPPPSPYQIIDTLKESQKMAAHSSHRLDFLSKLIDSKGKLDTDFGLWARCYYGEPDALKYMIKYNCEDLLLLEKVYLFMRHWIKPHPNVGVYMNTDNAVCSYCGSDKLEEDGEYVTQAGAYKTFRCKNCGGISRHRFTSLSLKKRKNLLVSTAR